MSRRVGLLGAIVAVALGLVALWVLIDSVNHRTVIGATPSTVTYKIEGAGTAMITYVVGPGFSEQQVTAPLPWSITLTGDKAPTISTINAQHTVGAGTISCSVQRDGTEVAAAQSSGQYVVVMCTPPVNSP